jgi:hypothetical protein
VHINVEGFYGAEDFALLAKFFAELAELRNFREKAGDVVVQDEPADVQGALTPTGALLGAAIYSGTQVVVETEAPAKRTRRSKAQIEADAAAAEKAVQANISTTPEDRQDPEVPEEGADVVFPDEEQSDFFDEAPAEEDDLIDGYPITDAGLVAAMQAYVAKFDMAAAQNNAKILFGGGHTKRSEVTAAGEAAIAKAIRNFSNAVNTGKTA